MTDSPNYPNASTKNMLIFATIWLGEGFLILIFVKWAFHKTASVYLLMIPWVLFGLLVALRPKWFKTTAIEKMERDMKRLSKSKWTPPGFP